MRHKKLLALFLSLAMLLSTIVLPQAALAYDYDAGLSNDDHVLSANKANLSFVYLGTTAGLGQTAINAMGISEKTPGQMPVDPTITSYSNQVIWIGVQVSKMSRVWDLMNPSKSNLTNDGKSRTTFNDGLYGFTLGLTYNSKYLKPYSGTTTYTTIFERTVAKNYTTFINDDDEEEPLYGTSTATQSLQNGGTKPLQYPETPVLPTDDGALDTCVQVVAPRLGSDIQKDLGDRAKRMFQADKAADMSDEPVILAAFPFVMNTGLTDADRAALANGKEIIQGIQSFDAFTISTGTSGATANNDMTYQWYYDRSTSSKENLKNYFNITYSDGTLSDGVVDLFPSLYNVEFYDTEANATAAQAAEATGTGLLSSKLNLNKGDTVAKADFPADTNFPPITSGVSTPQVFTGKFAYIDANGGTGDFDENTAMASSMISSTNHTIYVYPVYTDATKVTFNSNYTSEMAQSSEKTHEEFIYVDPDDTTAAVDDTAAQTALAVDGYNVEGWYYDAALTDEADITALDTTKMVSGEFSLYAKWTQMASINFYDNYQSDNGGKGAKIGDTLAVSPGTSISDPANGTLTVPAKPTRTDYNFVGWNDKQSGTGTMYAAVPEDANGTVKYVADAAVTFSTNTDLYAIWEADGAEQVMVTFDKNADDAVDANPTSITINKGDAIGGGMPDDPTRTGYDFKGWLYTQSPELPLQEFTGADTVDEDTVVYAYWEPADDQDKVTVTFNDHDATTAVNPTSITIVKGDSIGSAMPDDPKKDGYAFGGWYTDENGGGTEFTADDEVDADITVHAYWKENITINFYDNYTTSGEGVVTGKGKLLSSVTISPDTKISANQDGSGNALSAPDVADRADGYEFSKWSEHTNGASPCYDTKAAVNDHVFSDDTDLYVIWQVKDEDEKAVMTFDANSESDTVTVDPDTVEVKIGDKITSTMIPVLDNTSRPGYDFLGWFEDAETFLGADAVNKEFDFDTGVTMTDPTDTAYAHWEYSDTNPDKAVITFYDDDKTTVLGDLTVKKDTPVGTLPTAVKEGYVFDGWELADKTVFDENSEVSDDTDVYAKYISNVNIEYYKFAADSSALVTSTGNKATDKYTEPTFEGVDITNGDYLLVGWNTQANGSGTYIAEGDNVKYETVYNTYNTDTGNTGTVKLYAQWARVPDEEKENITDDPETPAEPDEDGVRVIFDSNAPNDGSVTAAAKPGYKYPIYGDKLEDVGGLPNDPSRTDYDFKGWNTRADGLGVPVAADTVISSATISEIKKLTDTPATYELTLYAQWEVSDDVDEDDKITVTFYKNFDGDPATATSGDKLEYKIKSGDKLGFVPGMVGGQGVLANDDHDNYVLDGWTDDGTVKIGDYFTADTAITDDNDTYYAIWKVTLIAGIYDTDENYNMGSTLTERYTGEELDPKYIIYEGTPTSPSTIPTGATPLVNGAELSSHDDFEVEYYDVDDTAFASVIPLKNVGDYSPRVVAKSTGAYANIRVEIQTRAQITISAVPLKPIVDVEKQTQKPSDTLTTPVVRVEGLVGDDVAAPDSVYEIKYYKYVDDGNGTVEAGDLTEIAWSDLETNKEAGEYVVKVILKDAEPNYTLIPAEASVEGQTVSVYDPAANTGVADGQNIKFTIGLGKPWIIGLVVDSKTVADDDTVSNEHQDLDTYDSIAFDTQKAFITTQPDDDAPADEYYVRVDSEATTVDLKITPSDNNIVTVEQFTASYEVPGDAVVSGPVDGVFTVTVTLFSTDPQDPDVIDIITKDGDGDDAYEYAVHIQKLKSEPTAVFAPGNSPFGLIERMGLLENEADRWDADTIAEAKRQFANSDEAYGNLTYGELVPNNAQQVVKYTSLAWGDGTNYDLDEEALFVYQSDIFFDPGIKVYDQAGIEVTNATFVKAELSNSVLANNSVPSYKETETVDNDRPIAMAEDGSFDMSGRVIRPDVYEITYEFSYTDMSTGETTTVNFTRTVVILSRRGDILLSNSPGVNSQDADNLNDGWATIKDGSPLFAFRSADINITNAAGINSQDGDDLAVQWGALSPATAQQYYESSLLK